MLKLYNTLTGRKERFEPLVPKTVRMYVCGVTVYDYCHIGHARSALVFDVIRRHFENSGYRVEFVKNFTDVDDKIIKRATEQGVTCDTIAAKYMQAYHEDMEKLGICPASVEPRATEHMADIIELTGALLTKGLAYRVEGEVYFDVTKYPEYGRLSKRRLESMQAGARVEVDERKRHPMDFVLWKSSKPGEPSWDSPWGLGRPGWHIECSAMSIKHLGETFDIHGGGMDLIFPHHENEIAQSCSATGKEFARYWVHNGFVQISQEKMSKSLGNFFTIREIFAKSAWPEEIMGEILRYFLLSTHYHGPLEFSDQALQKAKHALDGFYNLFKRLGETDGMGVDDERISLAIERCKDSFQSAMDDDFNTPEALAALQGLRSDVNKLLEFGLSTAARKRARAEFRALGRNLGLFALDLDVKWQFKKNIVGAGVPAASAATVTGAGTVIPPTTDTAQWDGGTLTKKEGLSDAVIDATLAERNEARRKKDFKKADEIRNYLTDHGIIIEDKPDGTSRWKR